MFEGLHNQEICAEEHQPQVTLVKNGRTNAICKSAVWAAINRLDQPPPGVTGIPISTENSCYDCLKKFSMGNFLGKTCDDILFDFYPEKTRKCHLWFELSLVHNIFTLLLKKILEKINHQEHQHPKVDTVLTYNNPWMLAFKKLF